MAPSTLYLVIPAGPSAHGESIYPPVIPRGALQLASAATAHGWRVRIFDGYSFPDSLPEQFDEADVVGISVHGAPSIEPAIGVIRDIRRHLSSVPLLIGGNLAEVDSRLLASALPEGVHVISGGIAGAIKVLNELSSATMASTPWPALDYDTLAQGIGAYLQHPDFEYHLETRRGCPYLCFHCGTARTTVDRPPSSLEDELTSMADLAAAHGVAMPKLWVTDETFTANIEHAVAVCDLFATFPGIEWRAQTRVDCVTPRILERMAHAGCQSVAFGVEVPSDDGLALFGKQEEMVCAREAFRWAHAAGMKAEAILVFGAPRDKSTFANIFATLAQLGADTLQSYIYHPVPGSPWWLKYGSARVPPTPKEWSRLDFHSPPVTATSRAHDADAIARFLASLVWRPESARADENAMTWREMLGSGASCPDCGTAVTPDVYAHHADISVFRVAHPGSVIYVAVGRDEVIAFRRTGHHVNIHTVTRYLLDDSISDGLVYLCPRCAILSQSVSKSISERLANGEGVPAPETLRSA
ncbi:MAG: cobalamin-dependent protein [Acidobacteriota bacterium]|nr:cobalamin-dependent protein [Acidobacteriota bacterium]